MENQPGAPTKAGQTMGIAALVLGIIGIVCATNPCTGVFAVIPAILAIIFGIIGMNQAKKGNGKSGLPIAGLVLGVVATIGIALWVLVIGKAAKEVGDVIMQDSTFMETLDSMTMKMDSVMQQADSTINQ